MRENKKNSDMGVASFCLSGSHFKSGHWLVFNPNYLLLEKKSLQAVESSKSHNYETFPVCDSSFQQWQI